MLPAAVVVFVTIASQDVPMPVSALQKAKRVFVHVLLSTAVAYHVALTVNRESADEELLTAYRQVVKKAHPDKGGSKENFQKLQAAKKAWAALQAKSPKAGSLSASEAGLVLPTQTRHEAEARLPGEDCLHSPGEVFAPRQEGPTCGRLVCQEVPCELSSCFGSERCCSWELVGRAALLS